MKSWYKSLAVILGMIIVLSPIAALVFFGEMPGRGFTDRVELIDDDDPLSVYSQTLDVVVGQMVSATKYVQGESASDNVIYDSYKDILNINFKSQFSAMIGDAYTYQLGMSMSSNNLPDLFYCKQNELNSLIEQSMVEDLTEVYYKYASPQLRLALEYGYTGDVSVWNDGNPIGLVRDTSPLDVVSKDGKIYGFPFLADLFNLCPMIWIRTDWLAVYAQDKGIVYDDISEVMPKDFGEYIEIVRYFSSANLNSGKKSYGVGFGFDGAGLQGISNVYGAYPEMFLKDEQGSYTYGTAADAFKDSMSLYNELYRTGCIDPYSALDGQLLIQALAAGKIGTFIGEYWHVMWGLGDTVRNNPGCDWLPWAIRDYDGNIIQPMVPTNVLDNSCYSIRKGFSNPEVVFIIANHLIDGFFSDNGEFTKRMVEIRRDPVYRSIRDEVGMYSPVRLDAPNKNTRYAFDIQLALQTGETDHMSLDCKEVYDTIKQYVDDPMGEGKSFYTLYKVFGPTGAYTELMNYAEYDYFADKNKIIVNFKRPAYQGMFTDVMLQHMGNLKDYIGIELINIYTSPTPLSDSVWNNFLYNMNQKKLPEMLKSLNDMEV